MSNDEIPFWEMTNDEIPKHPKKSEFRMTKKRVKPAVFRDFVLRHSFVIGYFVIRHLLAFTGVVKKPGLPVCYSAQLFMIHANPLGNEKEFVPC